MGKKILKIKIPIWGKKWESAKTLHKTSQKEDWGQPQP